MSLSGTPLIFTYSGLGRSGVPTYVLQAKGRAPQVFSEVIGVDEILAGLKALEAAP